MGEEARDSIQGLTGLKASIKPDDDNGVVCEIVISAPGIYAEDGSSMLVKDAIILERDGQAVLGRLESIRLKVSGGRNLDGLVNRTIALKASQRPLPVTGAVELRDLKPEKLKAAGEKLQGAEVCAACGCPQNSRPKGKAGNGHMKKTGRCVCGCEVFQPGNSGVGVSGKDAAAGNTQEGTP